MSTQATSPIINRIVITGMIVCGLVAIVAVIGFLAIRSHAPVSWSVENIGFQSGVECYVFARPKLVVFLGDGGPEELFDSIDRCGHMGRINVNGLSFSFGESESDNFSVSASRIQHGKGEIAFLDGKCKMVISGRGTKLTLADGRKFQLDGKTPLWLRCKSDGTIDQLDELPEGFVEFFESPSPDPGMIESVESYPDAFQK